MSIRALQLFVSDGPGYLKARTDLFPPDIAGAGVLRRVFETGSHSVRRNNPVWHVEFMDREYFVPLKTRQRVTAVLADSDITDRKKQKCAERNEERSATLQQHEQRCCGLQGVDDG